MIIEIDTVKQEVQVLNEDTKDWEKGYLKGYQYTASISELITIDLEIALPHNMR